MDGRGLEIPEPASLLDEETVAFAADLIDRSAVAGQAEAALARPTGRRRSLPVRAVLAALLLLAIDDRPLHLTRVTELLFRRLSPASRALLGITGTAPDQRNFLAAYRRVRYCFHLICSTADPSGLPKNRCLTPPELTAAARQMTPQQATAARSQLETLINALIEASISVLHGSEQAAFGGAVGLDATAVPLFSRGPSRRTGLCASDPDGGWYVREGDHRDAEDHKGSRRTRIAWALEATIVTMARTPGPAPGHPNLALGLALTRPGDDPGGTGARVLASVTARGHRPGLPGADRAYSAARPESFHLPVRALGYSPVMDYRAGQPGIQANSGGALLVEGTWHCLAMPAPLIEATTDYRTAAITKDLCHSSVGTTPTVLSVTLSGGCGIRTHEEARAP